MKLIVDDWRRAWRWLSVQVATAAILFGAMPVDQQGALLEWVGVPAERLPAVFGLLFLVSRLVPQPRARGAK